MVSSSLTQRPHPYFNPRQSPLRDLDINFHSVNYMGDIKNNTNIKYHEYQLLLCLKCSTKEIRHKVIYCLKRFSCESRKRLNSNENLEVERYLYRTNRILKPSGLDSQHFLVLSLLLRNFIFAKKSSKWVIVELKFINVKN